GWKQVAQWIADDIVAGKNMSNAPLPDWVFDGRDGVHAAEGSYSPSRNAKLPRSSLPVYQRQRFPDPLLGEKFAPGETVFENDGLRMWHDGDGIAVVSFKTKMNTVSDHVLDGLQ
ncbi:MAG: 3-hydroxyacyl-CoA dehydrogenase, partial [Massilia sp.]